MKDQILAALNRVEIDYGVRVLYAVESGSRAWGFASADSDYDVRFLYVHSVEWYLSVHEGRDVIEEMLPGDLDLSGWDLRKALRLLGKSNPPLLEWLWSPIVYREDAAFVSEVRRVAADGWSPRHCLHHYLSMARGNFRTYLQGERVRAKKYLYVLRPLLACRWIERRGELPPVEFDALVAEEKDSQLVGAIEELLRLKKFGAELDDLPREPVLHAFIDEELERFDQGVGVPHRRLGHEDLDRLLRIGIGV